MLFVLIKNNLKLLLRDKLSIFILIVMPILLIAVLSSAFSEKLNTSYTMKYFNVGYTVKTGSDVEKVIPKFIESSKKFDVTMSKMTKDTALEEIKKDTLTAYVELDDNKYTIYKKDGFNVNSAIFENGMSTALYTYDGSNALISYLKEEGMSIKGGGELTTENKDFVNLETIKVDPVPNSTVYYGIVQIVYIIWLGIIAVSTMVSNERKYSVDKRIGLSTASSLTIFLGKLIPAVITVTIEVGIAAISSTLLMDINWGTSPLASAGILLLEVIAAAAFGITISLLVKSQALSIVIIFLSSFFFGFIGGSFQTYMFNFVSDNLTKLSPLYYINRTLVEFSTKGYSDYANSCVIVLIAISVTVTFIGILITAKRRNVA